jgi:hypothetical protein
VLHQLVLSLEMLEIVGLKNNSLIGRLDNMELFLEFKK